MKKSEIISKINKLKGEKKAVILAHNYQLPDVQDIADYTGDSLELSRIAAGTDAEVILFCGVDFMAETAKILSPGKIVLVPEKRAVCPMADMIDVDDVRRLKAEHPGVPVMCYVNSSAEVKAESDICCTSANSISLAQNVDSDEIIFVPDQSLGGYTGKVTGKKFILCDGYCPVHHSIYEDEVKAAKESHPDALVMAHPECTEDVLALADHVASTAGMLRIVKESAAREFIICTEEGLLHRLNKENPGKKFYSPSTLNVCADMKKCTLLNILSCLENMEYEIKIDEDIRKKALKAIDKMVFSMAK